MSVTPMFLEISKTQCRKNFQFFRLYLPLKQTEMIYEKKLHSKISKLEAEMNINQRSTVCL